MKYFAKALLVSLTLLTSSHSYALYRCGNVFQDRPCDAESAQNTAARLEAKPKASSSESAATAATTTSPFAITCARLGKNSLDISWKREGGALREAQYAKQAGNSEHRKLVDAVYERRGSALEVRAAVEADCVGEKQRAADASAAIAALQQSQGILAPAADTAAGRAAPAITTTPAQTPVTVTPKNDNRSKCNNLQSELTELQDQARRGGGASTMERINKERRAVDSKISAAKC